MKLCRSKVDNPPRISIAYSLITAVARQPTHITVCPHLPHFALFCEFPEHHLSRRAVRSDLRTNSLSLSPFFNQNRNQIILVLWSPGPPTWVSGGSWLVCSTVIWIIYCALIGMFGCLRAVFRSKFHIYIWLPINNWSSYILCLAQAQVAVYIWRDTNKQWGINVSAWILSMQLMRQNMDFPW